MLPFGQMLLVTQPTLSNILKYIQILKIKSYSAARFMDNKNWYRMTLRAVGEYYVLK